MSKFGVVLIGLLVQTPTPSQQELNRYIVVNESIIEEMFDEHGIMSIGIGVETYDDHGNMKERCVMRVEYINGSIYCWNGQH